MVVVWLTLGLGLLMSGAELLVRGAARLAAAVRITPLVIGLTVVAFGTSSPELAVSIGSAYLGKADLAVGNVVGSNIFNVLFILGLSAMITPLVVSTQLVRWDVPIMIVASVSLYFLSFDNLLNRWEGGLLFGSLIVYIIWLIRLSRRETQAQAQASTAIPNAADAKGEAANETLAASPDEVNRSAPVDQTNSDTPAQTTPELVVTPIEAPKTMLQVLFNIALVVFGLVLLVIGANWLVDSAVQIAQYFGVSELVIGLTIIAVGTSLPEVATSVIASMRGERDIAVGNAVGSNIFNIFGVLGLAALLSPKPIPVAPAALQFDYPVMMVVAGLALPIFFTGMRISRWEGALFFFSYVAYTCFLIMSQSLSR